MYRYISHLLISISLFSYNTAHAENVSTDKDNLISGSIGLEYGTFIDDLSSDDTDTVTLSSNFEISLTPKLKLGTDLRKTEFIEESSAPTSTLSSFNLGYAFSDKAIIRAFHTDEKFYVLDLETYGISTSYTGKKYSISGYVAKTDTPIFLGSEKIDVNGSNAHPVFVYLKKELSGMLGSTIKWNFTKFLISSDGIPYKRFSPKTEP